MALYTQKTILRAFGEMLEEMPFDKITVTALVKRCEIGFQHLLLPLPGHRRSCLLDAWFHLELGRFTGEGTDWHTSTRAVMRGVSGPSRQELTMCSTPCHGTGWSSMCSP